MGTKMIKLKDAIFMDEEMKKLEEKYLESGKILTAVRDLEDYGVDKGDKVKIVDVRQNGYFDVLNLRTKKRISLYSLEFVKNFK